MTDFTDENPSVVQAWMVVRNAALKWKKLGLVFKPANNFGWINSHAQVPTVLPLLEQGILRIYFSTRPSSGLSLTTYLDVSATEPTRIVYLHDRPILDIGPAGAFDEHGIMAQCCLRRGAKVDLYYLGWSRRVSIPYSNWIGLATSEDEGRTFNKAFPGPILDRTSEEIFSATGLFVLPDRNSGYRGWYAKGVGWTEVDGRLEERYLIAETHSGDGVGWIRSGKIAIAPNGELEAMTRPVVIRIGDVWHMWYCMRSIIDFRDGAGAYRIGYAFSRDGYLWTRDDGSVGIEASEDGWDSTMMAYPCVVEVGDKLLMFYCGNGFGAAGLGVAELDKRQLAGGHHMTQHNNSRGGTG